MKLQTPRHQYITTNFAKTPGQVDYVTRRIYEITRKIKSDPSQIELAISREREGFALKFKVMADGKILKTTLYGDTLMDAFDTMESKLTRLA